MDRSDILTLIKYDYSKDANGVTQKAEIKRNIFVNVQSASQSEWFKGNRSGLNPAYKFTLFSPDYEDEEFCEYKGVRYSIYRTYQTKTDILELHVQKVSGK